MSFANTPTLLNPPAKASDLTSIASPALTGTPTAPTATGGTNTTQIATTAFVAASFAPLASPTFTGTPAAPTATAGANTTQLATTAFATTADNLKANLASPTLTGTPLAPTAGAGNNSTQIATTAYVDALAAANLTLTNKTLTTPVLNGIPTGTGVASAATASTLVLRDTNANSSAANFLPGYTTVTTAAGTTTLTVSSSFNQYFTGSSTQTVTLPVASTVVLGQSWNIVNNSTGAVTVQSSGSNSVAVLPGNTSIIVTCILASGTSAASWSATSDLASNADVIAKVLTGYSSGAGTVSSADSILGAIQKLNGNIALDATLASPTFTGTPAAPTASGGTNTTQIATTAFVATSFAPLASPTFTGTPAAPTASFGTNTTQLATTGFVQAAKLCNFTWCVQSGQRALGYGDMPEGIYFAKAATITKVTFRSGTADASGTNTVALYSNTTNSATGTAISGASVTLTATSAGATATYTTSISIAAATYLQCDITALGTTPGNRLYIDVEGTWN